MFSGIITTLGEVTALEDWRIRIKAPALARNTVRLGDSVAVNGVCLTIADVGDDDFTADVMPETLQRTTLGTLRVGGRVNLEPALRLGDSVGGHLVTGHVDAVGTVVAQRDEVNARWFTIGVAERLAQLIAEKGSVAVDGISLTVVDVGGTRFTLSLIPHTLRTTTAGRWRTGSRVNVEVDMIARYVQRAVHSAATVEPRAIEASR